MENVVEKISCYVTAKKNPLTNNGLMTSNKRLDNILDHIQ